MHETDSSETAALSQAKFISDVVLSLSKFLFDKKE